VSEERDGTIVRGRRSTARASCRAEGRRAGVACHVITKRARHIASSVVGSDGRLPDAAATAAAAPSNSRNGISLYIYVIVITRQTQLVIVVLPSAIQTPTIHIDRRRWHSNNARLASPPAPPIESLRYLSLLPIV
jgi:hypothetical protein